ncbi:unnamed protein product, partial [Pylaiella littoralis]
REFNQLQVNKEGTGLQFAEIEIYDVNRTNIALAATPTGTNSHESTPITNLIDGNTFNETFPHPTGGARPIDGKTTITLDLTRGYKLEELNKIVIYNTNHGAVGGWTGGAIVTLHSSDGGDPVQIGGMNFALVQEFVITPLPDYLLLTPRVTKINATINEVPGALSYQVTVQEDDSTRVTHNGISHGDIVIGSLTPGTNYTVRLFADLGSEFEVVDLRSAQTLANVSSSYSASDYGSNGKFDLSGLTASDFSFLSGVMNDVFTTGEKLEIKLGTRASKVAFVKRGESVSTDDSIMVQFDSSSGSGQEFTMALSDTSTVQVSYDETSNSLDIGGQVVNPGESLVLDGKKMTVLDV